MLGYLNNSSLLGRNGCFCGGLNFITKKSENIHIFLHVGSSPHCNYNFKICSAVINGEIMSNVIEKVCCFAT